MGVGDGYGLAGMQCGQGSPADLGKHNPDGGRMMELKPSSRTQEYFGFVFELWPLLLFTATLTIMTAARHVKRSYLQRTPGQVILNLLWSAGISMALVTGAITILDHFEPDLSPRVHVGIAIAIGLGGMKVIDLFAMKYFGLKVTDYMDPDLLAHDRRGMTEEQRKQHYKHCPFKDECYKSEDCPLDAERRKEKE